MLMENILAFGVIGMLTALVMGLVISEAKKPMLLLFLILEGMFTGWISGVIWVYLTGGLEPNTVAFIIPVFVSAFFSILTIAYLPKDLWRERLTPVGNGVTVVTVALLVIVMIGVAWTSLPMAFVKVYNTEQATSQSLDWQSGVLQINQKMAADFSIIPSNQNMVQFKNVKSSINGFKMMEQPEQNGYMNFQVTMSVKGNWIKPYLKVAVFQDKDNDGKLSNGDILWSDSSYKMVLGDDDTNWKTNCIWENGQPLSSAFVAEKTILPIYHASSISVWENENGKTFKNTPEGYTAPTDMFSWDRVNDKIVSKEQVISYANIQDGQETTIKGKIYCSGEITGKNLILIQAYSADVTDPITGNAVCQTCSGAPLASEVIPFQIEKQSAGIGSEWLILAGLAVVIIVAIIYQKRKEWF